MDRLSLTLVTVALTTRILYRLRFMAEQRPFDTTSLVYLLPFVGLILEMGGVGVSSSEDTDEQVVLAIEFLTFHTETCGFLSSHSSEDILLTLIPQALILTFLAEILYNSLLTLCRNTQHTIQLSRTASSTSADALLALSHPRKSKSSSKVSSLPRLTSVLPPYKPSSQTSI